MDPGCPHPTRPTALDAFFFAARAFGPTGVSLDTDREVVELLRLANWATAAAKKWYA